MSKKKGKRWTAKDNQHYRHLAYLIHELACDAPDQCTYSEEYTTCPPPSKENRYHCMGAVNAENLAAEIIRGEKLWQPF